MKPVHFWDTFPTALGPFTAAVDADGRLTATAFGRLGALRSRLGPATLRRDRSRTKRARQQIVAYLRGTSDRFTLPTAATGTPFQQRVWRALSAIPRGATRTYGEIAAAIGEPRAARAVGRANATNPVCVLVPCHRVVGANGSLTGFAFGTTLKRRLLELEGCAPRKSQRTR